MKRYFIVLALCASAKTYAQSCGIAGASLQNPAASAQSYATAALAIKAAQPGAILLLGSGLENENVLIDSKNDLVIKSECAAKIERLTIRRSNRVTVDGLVIRPAKGHGVQLAGNTLANTEITLQGLDLEPKFYQEPSQGIVIGTGNQDIKIQSSRVGAFPLSGIVVGKGSRGIVIESTDVRDNLRHGVVAQDDVELTIRNSQLIGNGRSNLLQKQTGFGLANARSDLSLINLQNTTIAFNLGCLDRSLGCDISNPSLIHEVSQVTTTYGFERPETTSFLKATAGNLPAESEAYLAQSPPALKSYLRAFILHVRLAVNSQNALDKGFASLREKQIKACMVLAAGPETRENIIDILDIDSGRDVKKMGPYLKRAGDAPLELVGRAVTPTLCKKLSNGFSAP